MIYESQFKVALGIITNATRSLFSDEMTLRNIEKQQKVYTGESNISNILNEKQLKDKEDGKPFTPDEETARRQGEHYVGEFVKIRLEGAFAHYRAGNELECLRHILAALSTLATALGWEKASAYLDQQNQVLYKMTHSEKN